MRISLDCHEFGCGGTSSYFDTEYNKIHCWSACGRLRNEDCCNFCTADYLSNKSSSPINCLKMLAFIEKQKLSFEKS
jgi:hypothetical protein